MTLKIWQFATIMLMAVAMSAAFAHLMEMPAKMTFEQRLYVSLHRTLYPNFGRIAGIAEVLAVIAVVGLTWRLRNQETMFVPLLVSALLMVAAHVIFWILVQPANSTMASWSLDAIPDNWTQWRNRWEYAHAARAVLEFGAFGALVISLLREGARAVAQG
jgi:membrane-bound metal-dependent hydrolase YbcI (DUF457 family)